MKIIYNPLELKEYLKTIDKTIGFVPTMGALHQGHISLINKAKAGNEFVVVSIFVNPTQFLQGEDLEKYPKKDEADKKICELAGVDVLFFPTTQNIYSKDEVRLVAPNIRGYILEGMSRPGHFNGVLTIVMKLLNIVNPEKAYFGKKDAQQLHLIKLMTKQLFMSVEIVAVDTMRENDGLAMSSRNLYLSQNERVEALKISGSLHLASTLIKQNIFDVKLIIDKMKIFLEPLEISYVEIVNYDFEPLKDVIVGDTIILVEAKVGDTRLLDNIWI